MPPRLSPKPVLPVFVKEELVPDNCRTATICRACEDICGEGTIDGANRCNGLWRVHPFNETSRALLLRDGVTVLGQHITFSHSNPYLINATGGESQGTTLIVENLPISFGMDAVERCLIKEGYKLRGRLRWLKDRDEDGSLTNWRNGRRSVFIDIPKTTMKKFVLMGGFSAKCSYREMGNTRTCYRCLKEGHTAKDCPNEEVCFDCRKPGHRKGDRACPGKRSNDVGNDESATGEASGRSNEGGDDMVIEFRHMNNEDEQRKEENRQFVEDGLFDNVQGDDREGDDREGEERKDEDSEVEDVQGRVTDGDLENDTDLTLLKVGLSESSLLSTIYDESFVGESQLPFKEIVECERIAARPSMPRACKSPRVGGKGASGAVGNGRDQQNSDVSRSSAVSKGVKTGKACASFFVHVGKDGSKESSDSNFSRRSSLSRDSDKGSTPLSEPKGSKSYAKAAASPPRPGSQNGNSRSQKSMISFINQTKRTAKDMISPDGKSSGPAGKKCK